MISGYLKLRVAGQRLDDWDGDRETLAEAAENFCAAGYHADTWEFYVKSRFERIRYRLFAKGTIRRTLATLPDAEVDQLGQEIRRFVDSSLRRRWSWRGA